MKKLLISILFALGITPLWAVTVLDIDNIIAQVYVLQHDADQFATFANQFGQLRDASFSQTVIGSTQTISLNNAQKSGLLAQYQNYKNQIQNDLNSMP